MIEDELQAWFALGPRGRGARARARRRAPRARGDGAPAEGARRLRDQRRPRASRRASAAPPRTVAEAIVAALPRRRSSGRSRSPVRGSSTSSSTEGWLHDVLRRIVAEGAAYGAAPRTGQRVQVEFVSANPTGPLHVGHARNAVLGDAIARLLDAAGLRRRARVLLQRRRRPDGPVRRLGRRELPEPPGTPDRGPRRRLPRRVHR